MVDSAAAAESERLGDALVELETDGIAYGDLALTVAIHGPLSVTETPGRRYPAHLYQPRRQGDPGGLRAASGVVFADAPRNRDGGKCRSVFVSAGAVASMAPIFGPPVGTPRSGHLKKAALAVLETQWRTPYYYDLFKGDVGHTLVLGATGAGKILRAQLPSGSSPAIRSAYSHSRSRRLLPLADPVSRRRLHGAIPGRRARAAGFAYGPSRFRRGSGPSGSLPGGYARLLRIGGWTLGGEDPSEIRARVEDLYAFAPRTPDPWGAGPFAALKDVARYGAAGMADGAWGRYFR